MDFLHNHTTFSDGADSVMDMARVAKTLGINRFGISDHIVEIPSSYHLACTWRMPMSCLGQYFEAISEARHQLDCDNFHVLAGAEVDFFPENFEEMREQLICQPFDYIIAACHYVGTFCLDDSADDWKALDEEKICHIWSDYLEQLLTISKLKSQQCFHFFAHLDYPKIFGFNMPMSLRSKFDELLRAIAESGLGIEVNLAGLDKPCQDVYPAMETVARAQQLGIPVIVNGDCHSVTHLRQRFSLLAQYPVVSKSVI